ncbi:Mss4-like protein [Paraphoma chrysanthemicola]|uniref:Mss4-like protein n=1 Tax=Paraphoma chrysanthemicola TaxID=798071 RepID=A0A8K0VYG9_9PLEO|nr:Mss4-like protein [Paraphoma chrysanthemicola]
MSDTTKTEGSMPTAPDADAPKQTYSASCHCGAFKYTVTASPPLDQAEVMECNCSICTRNGYMFIYPPNENISFTKGDITELRSYTFGPKPKVAHYFCGTCGASCMARSIDPNFFAGITCINVRMFEDVDLKSLKIKFADGKSYKQEE